jgi:MOSC domain-containing protein YiiM
MRVLSIQVGLPKPIAHRDHEVETAIQKSPVAGPVMLRTLNLDGDRQADLTVHGGRDKAVYAYAHEAYEAWKRVRPQDPYPPGAMGENLTVEGLDESAISVGDRFAIGAGGAVLEVSEPRFPCHKLALKFNDPHILRQFMDVGRPGIYFRVVHEGLITAGDTLALVEKSPHPVLISELFDFKQGTVPPAARLREMLANTALTASWRAKLAAKLG